MNSFDSPESLRDAFKDLVRAWQQYLSKGIRSYFYSKQYRTLRIMMKTRLVAVLFFIFLGIISSLWLVRSVVYGQDGLVLTESGWLVALSKFSSWAIGSSLLGICISFARRKFQGFKRLFDFLVASLGLILLSPLFLIVSLLIKIDSPGPAFFKQERVGKDGKIFKMWKFRTMWSNADLETGPLLVMENDPRITSLGNFLRKTYFNELPQLINVFKGEMSLIGPRPELPELAEEIIECVPNFNERLKVKPGITGLAQVRYGYGPLIKDAANKLKYDLLYIKRMCWMLEMRILFWTVGKVLSGEGAR